MREDQTGLHKPEGGTKQRLTKSAYNSAPVYFPNCASICLGSRVSFDLPLAQALVMRRLATLDSWNCSRQSRNSLSSASNLCRCSFSYSNARFSSVEKPRIVNSFSMSVMFRFRITIISRTAAERYSVYWDSNLSQSSGRFLSDLNLSNS